MKQNIFKIISAVLFIGLIVCALSIRKLFVELREAKELAIAMQLNSAALVEEYQTLLDSNKAVIDTLSAGIKEGNKTIIIEQRNYETTKKKPLRNNITDPELDAWLEQFRTSNKNRKR